MFLLGGNVFFCTFVDTKTLRKAMQKISVLLLASLLSCVSVGKSDNSVPISIKLGSERIEEYLPFLIGKKVGIVANHTSSIGNTTHLVDSLLSLGVSINKIFTPEHGLRGEVEAGELISNEIDRKTKLPIISLYGSTKKPTEKDLADLDIMLFDMQDVGVRFYTYISTMHYVMEACAENGIQLIVLDRPNPNGWYIDGPVLDTNYRSFVGMHSVPLVHGMTIGEFARMINGEGWLKNGIQCDLTIVTCENYTHDSLYILPEKPSPNLPNQTSIYLYPSLGFFEGTEISIGRGSDFPFQIFGHPEFNPTDFSFTPESRPGASKTPPLMGKLCYGFDLRDYSTEYFTDRKAINIDWLLFAYQSYPNKDKFFNNYFNLLAGNNILKEHIIKGLDSDSIQKTWHEQIYKYKGIRKKYLLYPDFE